MTPKRSQPPEHAAPAKVDAIGINLYCFSLMTLSKFCAGVIYIKTLVIISTNPKGSIGTTQRHMYIPKEHIPIKTSTDNNHLKQCFSSL